jgi:protein required for attachment to host cells
MKRTWILVANRAEAKLFENVGIKPNPSLMEEFSHPKSREKVSELLTDKAGGSFERMGKGRNAMGKPVDPHAHEAEVFAKEIATKLEKARMEGSFDALLVIAEPSFLGTLTSRFSAPMNQLVSKTVDKNLPDMTPHTLRPHLKGLL